MKISYQGLLVLEKILKATIPNEQAAAWFELVGYPTHVLAGTGLLFLADRAAQTNGAGGADEWKSYLQSETQSYNNDLEAGKWREMMPDGNTDSTHLSGSFVKSDLGAHSLAMAGRCD